MTKVRDDTRDLSGPPGDQKTAAKHRPAVSLRQVIANPLIASDDEYWSVRTITIKTGLSRTTIYAYVAQGHFPRQRRLGPRRVGWLASEVRAWMASRPPQLVGAASA
jgi:prophage regulatory protein